MNAVRAVSVGSSTWYMWKLGCPCGEPPGSTTPCAAAQSGSAAW